MLTWDTQLADFGGNHHHHHHQSSRHCYYLVESCRLRSSSDWTTVKSNLSESSCVVEGLLEGETYAFRVRSHAGTGGVDEGSGSVSEPSKPSAPLTIPLGDALGLTPGQVTPCLAAGGSSRRSSSSGSSLVGAGPSGGPAGVPPLDSCWQRDFERRFIELEELGRGRFSVVRKCQEILSGDEVAVKFVNRRKQPREETRKEFEILSLIDPDACPSLIGTSGLFLTTTSDAIILKL